MSGRWRDKLQAPFTRRVSRLRGRPLSPSLDERREPGSGSALRETPLSASEEQSPSVHHQLKSSRPSTPTSSLSDTAFQPTRESYGLFIFGERRPPADYNLDIVAVHGLGGHWEKTWTDESTNSLWLRDFLPSQLPNARIMSYGYDSSTAFSKAVADIDDVAVMLLYRLNSERQGERTRPIIFISHSLGGIIVKKAIINACERLSEYGDLLNSVRGSIFFGVPHRGADAAYWATFAATVIKVTQLGLGSNKNFVSALQKNSGTFASISRQFVEQAAPLMIRTFYETERLFGQLIVDRDSACLGLANEIAVGVAGANHRTMCKFSKMDSQKYILVWRTIEIMSNSAVAYSATSSAPPSTSPSVPLSEEECKCLQSLYTSDYNSLLERVLPADEGTCTWFLRHKRYMAWRTEQGSSLLWVSAGPGYGKSVLSLFLVGKLRDSESQAVLPGTVCFFFFGHHKDATFALCTLLHQLFKAKNSLITHALKEFNNKGHELTAQFSTLWRIFTRAATDPAAGNVICVIDGLDECEQSTRDILIDSLVKFYSARENPGVSNGSGASKNCLKIILTSRPYLSIENSFRDVPRIRLEGEDKISVDSADIGVSGFEDNISIISDSDSSYASTSRFSNCSGSSNTTVPSVPQRFLEKVEDDIATVLASTCSSEVTRILSGVVQKQSQTTVNRRLSRALREFSSDVRKLQTTKKLSMDELSILRSIRNKDTLDAIALRISRVFAPKTDNLRLDNLRCFGQLSKQEIVGLLDFRSSDGDNPVESDGSDESDESEDTDGEEEPASLVGPDWSIERIIDYFKSREVLEVFERIVVKRFTRVRRKPQSKQNAHGEYEEIIQGVTPVLEDAKDVDRYSWPAKFSAGKTDVIFEIGRRWSLLNQAKGWIEGHFGEPINWWPLEPRRHPLPEGFIWATWKCRCGERVSSAISEERRNQYNQWINTAKRACSSSNVQATPGTTDTAPAAAQALSENPQSVPTVILQQTPSASGSTSTSAIPAPPSTSGDLERDGGKDKDKHLLWCINLGTDTVVSNLVVSHDDNDTKIFLKLKNEYRKVRSWRIYFSLYSISEIKFVKFRYFLTRYASCDRDPALPDTHHKYYEYQPRPVEDMPPIPPQQLMMFFRKPSCAVDSDEVVHAIPKKLNGELNSDERHGWGLHACEHFSFIKAFLLFLFIQAFFLWFFIYWIRNHKDDYQNATALWALFLALFPVLAFFLKTSN